MKTAKTSIWSMLLMVSALAVIGVVYFRGLQQPLNGLHDIQLPISPSPPVAKPDGSTTRPVEAPVSNPIEQTAAGRLLATVPATSDPSQLLDVTASPPQQSFELGLAAAVGTELFSQLFVSDDLINRIVVTVDNLSQQKLPPKFWPLRPVGGQPLATGEGEALRLAADNGARYAAYITLLQQLDLKLIAALYGHDYERFQQAYLALGNPNAYFNDRLVDVIDHLLVTPAIDAPLALVQPTVMYKFADEGLEARSLGQKLLLRVGPANAGIIKTRLRELRRLVTRATP